MITSFSKNLLMWRSSTFVTLYFLFVFVLETLIFNNGFHDSFTRFSSLFPSTAFGIRSQDPKPSFPSTISTVDKYLNKLENDAKIREDDVRNNHFRPLWFGVELFVAVSTYRTSQSSFVVIGEVSMYSSMPFDVCVWKNHNRSIIAFAKTTIFQGGTTKGRIFRTTLVKCSFDDFVGSNSQGGYLYLSKSDQNKLHLVHVEPPGQFSAIHSPPKHNVVFCGPPMHGIIQSHVLAEWFAYHAYVVQINQFFLYDYGGIDDSIATVLKPFMDREDVVITKMEGWEQYHGWYYHQQTNNCDCLYRTKFISKWVLFTDFDEFLFVPKNGQLSHFLADLDADTAWASFGSIQFHEAFCSPKTEKDETLLERMVWRHAGATCRRRLFNEFYSQSFCPRNLGHRKVVVNPRLTEFIHIHEVLSPPEGVVWNASVDSHYPRIYHFRRILNDDVCTSLIEFNSSRPFYHGYFFDSSLKDRVQNLNFRKLVGV